MLQTLVRIVRFNYIIIDLSIVRIRILKKQNSKLGISLKKKHIKFVYLFAYLSEHFKV